MSSVKECLLKAKGILKKSGAGEYALDAELFMMETTGFTRVQLFTKDDYSLTTQQEECFFQMVKRRENKVPAQYILGRCQFMGLEFYVDENVLIPRPDTEILVEEVLERAKKEKIETILDLGTGSGCIPISIVKYGVKKAVAVDISRGALSVAKRNSVKNGVEKQIEFVESNLFENLGGQYFGAFDAIVSNPPYIEKETIKTLMEEVKDKEPMLALDGGEDGLDFYRKIIPEGRKYLREEGYMFFEIGYNQGASVTLLMEENGFADVQVIKDLAGLDRVVIGRKR